MKYTKFIPYAVIAILIIVFLSVYPSIERGKKLDRLQELSNSRNYYEQKKLDAQEEAKQLRIELGLIQASQPQVVVKTGTQVQQLTGSIIE